MICERLLLNTRAVYLSAPESMRSALENYPQESRSSRKSL